jgi:Concanavalin A-like lectin/glucanases superfamily
MPLLHTADAAQVLQATLQHVVMTYDPIKGRRIYVNGVYTGTGDTTGASLGNWQDDLVLVLGNEVSNTKPWLGTLKFVAIHNRALTPEQVKQNFDAGVGEKYFVLFSVSHLVDVPQAYVMFEVSIYDSYAYLFNHPTFISLDPNAKPGSIIIKGMRIGINGSEPVVGQAYKTLNTTITDSMYTPIAGASLSNVGTIIASERGAAVDEFFLTFEQLGSNMDVRVEATPTPPPAPANVVRPSDIGVRTFDAINETFSKITGVDKNTAKIKATYSTVKQQLPGDTTLQSFLASNQMGVAQLAISYCNEMVDDTGGLGLRTKFFPNANTSSTLQNPTEISAVVDPIVSKVAQALNNQPSAAMTTQLTALISNTDPNSALGLCAGSNVCGGSSTSGMTRTATVMKAACAAGLGSAVALVQ